MAQAERGFAQQREVLAEAVKAAYQAQWRAQLELDRIERQHGVYEQAGVPWPAPKEAERRQAADEVQARKNAYLAAKARLDTKADDSALLARMRKFDQQLMEDAEALDRLVSEDSSRKLRPHYQGLLDAYRAEFMLNQGLRDAGVIAFFSKYVHDALAGFDKDDTRPSDPRIIYVGGDNWLRYAVLWPGIEQAEDINAAAA